MVKKKRDQWSRFLVFWWCWPVWWRLGWNMHITDVVFHTAPWTLCIQPQMPPGDSVNRATVDPGVSRIASIPVMCQGLMPEQFADNARLWPLFRNHHRRSIPGYVCGHRRCRCPSYRRHRSPELEDRCVAMELRMLACCRCPSRHRFVC